MTPKPLTWRRLEAIGTQDLGLSKDEFWRLTPAMFSEYMGRRQANLLSGTWQQGVIASLIANQWKAKDAEPSQPWDWFPELLVLKPKTAAALSDPDAGKKSPAQLFGLAKAITIALGGKVLKQSYP